MISNFTLKKRLEKRKDDLNKLDRAYMNWIIGDDEYEQKRPILLGRIEELEELCHIKQTCNTKSAYTRTMSPLK